MELLANDTCSNMYTLSREERFQKASKGFEIS